jgi:signal transduction histidine kinase/CheY-like chemotaxis protein
VNALAPAAAVGPVSDKVRLALVVQLFASTPQAVLGGIAFAAVVAGVGSAHSPSRWAWGWFALKAVIGLVRILHARRFLGRPREPAELDGWMRSYVVWIAIDTVSWAAMLPLFGPGADALALALLMCGLVGIASLGVFTTVSHWPVCVLYSSTCMGTLGVWFGMRGGPGDWAVALGSAIYLALLIVESRRGHDRLVEMLRLRFENAALAEQRAEALAAAESSNAAKGRFLAMVSHEMRTPLNGIMGMAQVLRAQVVEPASARSLALLENSARLLARIIGDLLDFARMDSGRVAVRRQPMDLRHDVEETAALLQPLAEARGLRLEVQWSPEATPYLDGDATRIGQVLHNLVGNALKFTERGSVTLRVRPSQADRHCIEVVDTGPGIAPADQERIFEAFERVGDVGLVPGTGLGLTIARRLARALDGDVICRSDPGAGSTFVFTFTAPAASPPDAVTRPMSMRTDPDAATPPAPAESRDGPAPTGAERAPAPDTVLVVDDNEINTLVAAALLEQLGWRHASVANGEQALQAMAGQPFAAVLMDCHMPVLDGWEATRRWRLGETGVRLPIIGITANAAAEDRQSCLAAGMDDHLPKPFDMSDLEAALRRLVGPPPRAAAR